LTPEGRVKAGCLKYLKRQRIKAWSNPTGAVQIRPGQFIHFGLKGSSDILGVLPGGRFLAVECKAEHGRLSPEQRDFLKDVKRLGGLAIVARHWKDIDTALRQEGLVDDGPLFSDVDVC
jgi:hypothetical protein